jgi:hypothetical protein
MEETAEGASQREGEEGSREKRKSARKKRGRGSKKRGWGSQVFADLFQICCAFRFLTLFSLRC